MGWLLYLVMELCGAFSLAYITALQGHDLAVISCLRLLELLVLVALIRHFQVIESLGLNKPNRQAVNIFFQIAITCGASAALLYAVQPTWFLYVTVPAWLHGLQGVLLMVLLAPIVEEIFFRGLLYRILRERWGVFFSVAVSATLFSLLHHGLIISPQLAGGIIFALAYEWSRSLWVAIALHIGANSVVYLLAVLGFAS